MNRRCDNRTEWKWLCSDNPHK